MRGSRDLEEAFYKIESLEEDISKLVREVRELRKRLEEVEKRLGIKVEERKPFVLKGERKQPSMPLIMRMKRKEEGEGKS